MKYVGINEFSPSLYERDDLGVRLAANAVPVDGNQAIARVQAGRLRRSVRLHVLHENRVHRLLAAQLGTLAFLD